MSSTYPTRWVGITPDERSAVMADVRASMTANATQRAREQAAALGLILTDEQAAEAGRRVLHQEQAARAAQARAAKAAKTAERQQTFAIAQAKAAAQRYLDLWGAPATTQQRDAVLRRMLDLASEECLAPDGFKAGRLMRRLNIALNDARALASLNTDRLNASLVEPVDWDALPTADDIAAEHGEKPWAQR